MTTRTNRCKPLCIWGLCLVAIFAAPACLERTSYTTRPRPSASRTDAAAISSPTNGHSVAHRRSDTQADAYYDADSQPQQSANDWRVQTDGFSFAQVSLFGDLPNLPHMSSSQQSTTSLQQHTFAVEGACFDPVISPNGERLAFASTQHHVKPDIYIKPISAATMTQLTSDPASDVQPAFSPDGDKIAFCSDRTGNWDIFAILPSGAKLQQLTDDPAPEMHPTFSPDGKQLAYCRYNLRSGQWEIWMINLDGVGQRRFIAAGLFPTFSPVDRKIVYQRARQRGSRWFSIWQLQLRGTAASIPTEIASSSDRALTSPRWSPDGKNIVYCAVKPNSTDQPGTVTGSAQIWTVAADGTDKMPITDPGIGCFSPVWNSDGRIFFCANRGGSENVWSVLPMVMDMGSAEANTPVRLDVADVGHGSQPIETHGQGHAGH